MKQGVQNKKAQKIYDELMCLINYIDDEEGQQIIINKVDTLCDLLMKGAKIGN